MLLNEIRKNAGLLNENYENLSDYDIYQKGNKDPDFNFDKGLDALLEKDKIGDLIYMAGVKWKEFDFKKGLDALLEKDKDGQLIYSAGLNWKTFDFKKGFDTLISKDKTGDWIYRAGKKWKTFDFKKGMEVLEKIGGEYLEEAKKDWPKSYPEKLKDVKDKYDENHIPGKRKKLKR